MASYMYTSASGKNWDDDDDDHFDPAVYESAAAEFGVAERAKSTLSSARLALEELEKQSAAEYDQAQEYTQPVVTTASQISVDYDCHPDYFPTFAGHITESWFGRCSRPAYTALSNKNGYVYPYERRDYHANWLAAKLRMGANMKNTAMMAPSNLHLSRTWVNDSLGEYVEDRGYEYLSLPPNRTSTPRLSMENESGDERDEAQTPPDTPSMAKASKSDVEVGEYDPTTGAIDLPAQSIKSMDTELAHDSANFSSIAEDLSAEQILGEAGQRMLNAKINEDALRLLVSNIKARPVVKLTNITVEATLAVSSSADEAIEIAFSESEQLSSDMSDHNTAPVDCDTLTKVPTQVICESSPDTKYIVDPTNTSLVWNTVAAGWFALSSLPWGRMAVAAASALVNVAVFIARH